MAINPYHFRRDGGWACVCASGSGHHGLYISMSSKVNILRAVDRGRSFLSNQRRHDWENTQKHQGEPIRPLDSYDLDNVAILRLSCRTLSSIAMAACLLEAKLFSSMFKLRLPPPASNRLGLLFQVNASYRPCCAPSQVPRGNLVCKGIIDSTRTFTRQYLYYLKQRMRVKFIRSIKYFIIRRLSSLSSSLGLHRGPFAWVRVSREGQNRKF
ncbi:hypothetical protein SCHPADRAFT_422616 [Schizopora paradoxa]|uniref:Uncharacterized protein n=1 Tax=Schizopora paradoxa TaxID=27342 RepID=A0A0H2RL67_9AGAM|nr:hypothetical protein SCHPADRAFT_422616 [Schizopora paradoxa]